MSEHKHAWVCGECGAHRYRTHRRTDVDTRRMTAYLSGIGVSQIARDEGVSRQAVYATLRKSGLTPKDRQTAPNFGLPR